MKALTKKDIEKLQKKYPDWTLNKPGNKLTATLKFKKHVEAMVFLARMTVHMEVVNHHPEVVFFHAKLKITTTTHDAGNTLTKLDADIIKRIETLREKTGE